MAKDHERDIWATQAGKAPRKVVGPEVYQAVQGGADLHTVKSKPVKIKVRRSDAKKAGKAAKKEEKGKGK